jgi:isopentenyl diphosphate isomerase/L-lactate dehydrogenase-like FMN-dependent dehydrogenase
VRRADARAPVGAPRTAQGAYGQLLLHRRLREPKPDVHRCAALVHTRIGPRAHVALANTDAFDRYRLRPRMLVDATVRDCSVELFGRKHASPLLVGPVGVQEIFHRDAEEATARACAAVGVPMVLSTAATRSIEQVAAANGDGERWFQVRAPFGIRECMLTWLAALLAEAG